MGMNEELELEEALQSLVQSQSLDLMRVSAISEACDRRLREDPSMVPFVKRMAELAKEANRRGADDIPWAALAQILRESAGSYEKRTGR